MRLSGLLTAALLALAVAACGPAGDRAAEPPADEAPADEPPAGETPADPRAGPLPDEIDPPEEATMLVGVFDGDPHLEGGCAWLDADEGRFEVLWPDGYQVEFEPLRLIGPDGEVVAERGDTLGVHGRVARDVATICQIGQPYQADDVERR